LSGTVGIHSQEFSTACSLQPLATPFAEIVSSALGGELNTIVTFVVEDGRIAHVCAIRTPHELGRVEKVVELRRYRSSVDSKRLKAP
jgi:hypothetical protein